MRTEGTPGAEGNAKAAPGRGNAKERRLERGGKNATPFGKKTSETLQNFANSPGEMDLEQRCGHDGMRHPKLISS